MGGVKCTTKMKEYTNICKHVKRHFPELKEQLNTQHKTTPRYQAHLKMVKESTLTLQLKERRNCRTASVKFNSQKDGPLKVDLGDIDSDFITLTSKPHRSSRDYKCVYFMLMLPSKALGNAWGFLTSKYLLYLSVFIWNTNYEMPVYIGKNHRYGTAMHHAFEYSNVSTYCRDNHIIPVCVHRISFENEDDEKNISDQELTECWYHLFVSYSETYEPQEGQLHFIMINEKIEEVAATKNGMKKEDIAIAKAAAKNNLPLFCIPGCEETHNSGKLPYYPRIHLCQAPELPRGFKVQADKLKKPKIDTKLSSAK